MAAVSPLVERVQLALDENGIAYCHWKSNEHLEAALAGDTDLDVLFREDQEVAVTRVLRECGLAPCVQVWYRKFPHIKDFVGIDQTSGKLIHLHAHFQLVVGEEFAKSFRLPWEEEVLDGRKLGPSSPMPFCDPNVELLLLLVRMAIKFRHPSPAARVKNRLRPPDANGLRGDVWREYEWLWERVDPAEFRALSERLLGPEVTSQISVVHRGGPTDENLALLYRSLRSVLDQYAMYGTMRRTSRRWIRWTGASASFILRRQRWVPHRLRRYQKRPIGRGAMIGIVGVDGSGKSTLCRELVTLLSTKLDTMPVYLGSGDGPGGLLRAPARAWRRGLSRPSNSSSAPPEPRRRAASRLARTAEEVEGAYWAITLALERRSKLRRGARARDRGVVVVTDRFPQVECKGYNDGPLLDRYLRSPAALLRRLGRWELSLYEQATAVEPDLLIRLAGSPDEFFQRRPDTSVEYVRGKQDALLAIGFPAAVPVVELDAGRPASDVLVAAAQAVGAVWEQVSVS